MLIHKLGQSTKQVAYDQDDGKGHENDGPKKKS